MKNQNLIVQSLNNNFCQNWAKYYHYQNFGQKTKLFLYRIISETARDSTAPVYTRNNRYVFGPHSNTIMTGRCLTSITELLMSQSLRHKGLSRSHRCDLKYESYNPTNKYFHNYNVFLKLTKQLFIIISTIQNLSGCISSQKPLLDVIPPRGFGLNSFFDCKHRKYQFFFT